MSKKQKIRTSQGMMQHSVLDYGIKGMKPVKSGGGLDAIKFIPLGKAAAKFLREHPHFAQNLFDKIGEFGILAVASSFENLADNPSMMTDANKDGKRQLKLSRNSPGTS